MGVDHIRIKSKKHTEGPFNIQLPNGYHSLLKNMVNHRFRGVSTKYLNNYLVYHNLVNFSKVTDKSKEDAMFSFTLSTKCSRRYVDIPTRAHIPLLKIPCIIPTKTGDSYPLRWTRLNTHC